MKIAFAFGIYSVTANSCTNIGGRCTDWRYTNCPGYFSLKRLNVFRSTILSVWKLHKAGYQQGLCPGDSNQRCCLNCNPSCQADEEYFLQFDGPCTSSGGACLVNSNYCAGYYSSGKCGGYNNRQCCSTGEPGGGSNPTDPTPTEPPSGGTGDYFWNSYTGYTLDGSASSTLYSSYGFHEVRTII